MARKAKVISEEDRKAKREEQREKIDAAVATLRTDSGWLEWIKSHKTLSRFSFLNRIYVMVQIPEVRAKFNNADPMTRTESQIAALDAPMQVHTYNAWKREEIQVQRGEKCLIVLKPIFGKKKKLDEDGNETGEFERIGPIHFEGLSEFDITQTDAPIPVRPAPKSLSGNEHADVIPILVDLIEKAGYKVDLEAPKSKMGSALAHVDDVNKIVRVLKGTNANEKVHHLVHEYAHTREDAAKKTINYQDYSRNDAEVIVETVTMMVSEFLGFDTSGFSVVYLAGWARPEDKRVFQRFASAIDKITNEIEDAIREGQETAPVVS